MVYYAQLNENNVCIGISSLKGEVQADNMVQITEYSEDYIWRKYENGQWSKEKFLPDYGQIQLDRMESVEQAVAELPIILAGGGLNENSGLVRVWVNLIKEGKRTLSEVPNLSNLKTVVEQVLAD